MIVLTLRTDKPEAEVGLYEDTRQLAYETWTAHRQLAETLHAKILEVLQSQDKTLHDIEAVACYAGPGSFTGLRIGLSVANALAYALEVPIAAEPGSEAAGATSDDANEWLGRALARLQKGEADPVAMPEYGADPHITPPKS